MKWKLDEGELGYKARPDPALCLLLLFASASGIASFAKNLDTVRLVGSRRLEVLRDLPEHRLVVEASALRMLLSAQGKPTEA